jgi:membrane protein implicated in regulation of membrane protease activity
VTVATFATSFGGLGLVLARVGLPGVLSLPLAGASGLALAGAVFYVFFLIFRVTQSSSAVSPRQSLGKPAEVITAIPKDGAGEIAYVLGGRRFTAAARTEDGRPIPRKASVVIVRITRAAYFVCESAAEP